MMNTARAVGNVALIYAVAVIGGAVGSFLSALVYPILSAYRDSHLHRHGAPTILDLIHLSWRREAPKRAAVWNSFLLAVQLCLFVILILSGLAIFIFPPVLASPCLGYLGGWCFTNLTAAYYAPATHVFLDKTVFMTVYIVCCFKCLQCVMGDQTNRFVCDNHICVGVVLGCVLNYVLIKGAHKVTVFLVSCLMCGYVVYSVMGQRDEVDLKVDVLLLVANLCLGFFVGRGMMVRTNYMVSIVCSLFGWLVWLSFSQIIFTGAKMIALKAQQVKMEIVCVEIVHFCVVLMFMRKFLVERGFSETYLFHIIGVGGFAFNFVICRLIQLV